jgi:DNA-binding winged helix-turn-helix (wHTH) protein/CheY-like chemotaxis protein
MTTPSVPTVFRLGAWRVLRDQNRLEHGEDGRVERIEPKAMDVLCVLAGRAGETVSRDELLEAAWAGRLVVEGALSRVILALRTALGDDARAPSYIETVPKRGYRLVAMPVPMQTATNESAITEVAAPEIAIEPAEIEVPASIAPAAASASRRFPPLRFGFVALAAGPLILALGFIVRLDAAEEIPSRPIARVLWVDNNPAGNAREIASFEKVGLIVDTAASNAEAAELLRGREYDVLISDIQRGGVERDHAGLDLPREALPDRNRLPPIVYYTGRVDAERTGDGYPVTNQPERLFELVMDVLRWRDDAPPLRLTRVAAATLER